jgi:hypothetical protein
VEEADGQGFPPEDLRAAIIAQGGLWHVQLEEAQSKALVAKVLRRTLTLSPMEALPLVSSGGEVIWRGTRVEIEWLVSLLADAGVGAHGVEEA